jgi:hypothetical protein
MRSCVIISWIAMLVGCASSEEPADQRQCARLRDHLVDLQLSDVHVAVGIDRAAHRRALAQALGPDFVASCSNKLTESQVDCALNTNDRAAAAVCAGAR